ncbi:PLP-dependent aminotransferase family protein [Neptunomonas japonica]|uniref:GntR family transcriptional regulator n=1 Tax=Neptunomonas japonica JAMM 1380 TaxID=1441457 RepID=A0A7R6PRX6_9GAMM|nr:PLP-dependent aminotransferase family protein [Neptunomonas japonica]BBB29270.1 GntR family transcriptional regulator [Neptunomonas japonica JAMM 1380]
MKLYEKVAHAIAERIEQSFYQAGEKLPSIRALSLAHEVSISTAQEAYRLLEDQGWAESRPKSGFYVINRQKAPQQLPDLSRPTQRPIEVSQWEEVLSLLSASTTPNLVQLSRAIPDLNAPTLKPLTRILSDLNKNAHGSMLSYEALRGSDGLRLQVARLMVDSGCRLHPDDIIITAGCQEALSSSLRAVTKPGDVVAVDSPSFYGSMQAIKAHGLKVLEIPTHPETGVSIEALELALEQWPIKAIQITPTCNNPLGYTMPVEHKKRLLALTARYDIPIIEDDIYGDLSYTSPRPPTIKSFDTEGRVLLCSSFSKTLAPGFRIGWVAPGRYGNQVMHMKYVVTASTPTITQLGIAEFIAQGGYERHIRKVRAQYHQSRDVMIGWVEKYFPQGTKISYPQGGFLLWVELPDDIDTITLNERTMTKGVSIAPGVLFSASGKYRNCMRLNFTDKSSEKNENAIKLIASTIHEMVSELKQQPHMITI